MKRKILVALLLVVGLLTFTGCGKTKSNSSIKSFTFNFGGFWGQSNYSLIKEEDGVKYKAVGYNGVNLDEDKTISTSYLDELKKVIDDNNLQDWNNFDEKDNDVLDGEGFYLEIIYEDGTTIKASGSNKFPDNYGKVKEEMKKFFDTIK